MKLLIVAATHFEIGPLLNLTGIAGTAHETITSVTYKNLEIDFLVTGVGMVATTYHVTKSMRKDYNVALNVGLCGSFNKNLAIGSVVNVYHDCFSELGAEDDEKFLSLNELHLPGDTEVFNETKIKNNVLAELPKVNGITVNTVHGNEKSIDKVFGKFHPIVETMEGAAFMFVCKNENIPFAQIRAVSNFVELRNKNNWDIPLAIENLNNKILEILKGF